MRKAKIGFEDIFNNATAKLETLEAEAKAKVEAMIAEDKQTLLTIIEQSSVEISDPIAVETPELNQLAEAEQTPCELPPENPENCGG